MRGTIVSVESPSRGCLLPPVTVLSSSQQANCYANFPKLQTRAEKCKLTKINFPNWSNIGSSSSCWKSPSACSGTVCKNGQDVDRWHSMKRNARQKFPETSRLPCETGGGSQRYKPLANKDHQNLQHHIMRWKTRVVGSYERSYGGSGGWKGCTWTECLRMWRTSSMQAKLKQNRRKKHWERYFTAQDEIQLSTIKI